MPNQVSLSPLYSAQVIVRTIDARRAELEAHLAPFLKQYIDFMAEVYPRYLDSKDETATTFAGTDEKNFLFEGEEYYDHGDYETPTVELPFAFVEDPEAFMKTARDAKAAQEAKHAAAMRKREEERINLLRRQLAVAENTLAGLDNPKEKD